MFATLAVRMLAVALAATQVTSIDFRMRGGSSEIEITADGPISVGQRDNPAEQQLILELSGAKLGPMASRPLDTSSFENSPVSLINPFSVSEDQARIVIQLKESAQAVVEPSGNKVLVRFGAPSASASDQTPLPDQSQTALDAPPPSESDVQVQPSQASGTGTKQGDKIDQFLGSRSVKTFNGDPVTVMVRDADVREVLRLISDASGFNIVVGPGVEGKLTLSLADVPWDQALDVVLQTLRLGAERNGNILRVLTLTNLKTEKEEEIAARKASEEGAARVTKVLPISYADPKLLETTLKNFGSSGVGKPTGTVGVDDRTNSIIIQDIQDNIDRMTKLVQILDTQTPQVMVEAKIVEASESFSRSLGGNLGFSTPNATATGFATLAGFNGSNPIEQLIGNPLAGTTGVFTGATVATGSAGGGTIGVSPFLGIFGGTRINAVLTMGETEQEINIVSAPKTVVLNKENARILSSSPVLVNSTVLQNGVPVQTNSLQQANLSLDVTPTVTNDDTVLMRLTVTRDIPTTDPGGNNAVANRNLTTRVLVESGSTLVIGGIYTYDKNLLSTGFPVLRKLPILGWLFGSDRDQTTKNELFIFVTPKILNTARDGVGT